MVLPSAQQQQWEHAVNDRDSLNEVLEDRRVTAIESDLVLGMCPTGSNPSKLQVIMAHPPHTTSDLTMLEYLDLISKFTTDNNNNSSISAAATTAAASRFLPRNVKLDFKEIDVIQPTLQAIMDKNIGTTCDNIFFINADVLAGPGYDESDVIMNPDIFFPASLSYINQQPETTTIAYSLGFRTRFETVFGGGYTRQHYQRMAALIRQYHLVEQNVGIVIALNGRQLEKNLNGLRDSIDLFDDGIQFLVWTGRGEPPLRRATIDKIENYFFHSLVTTNRLGFDVRVIESAILGAALDCGIGIYGAFSSIGNLFSSMQQQQQSEREDAA